MRKSCSTSERIDKFIAGGWLLALACCAATLGVLQLKHGFMLGAAAPSQGPRFVALYGAQRNM